MARQLTKYHYAECGLDNVYLINGFTRVITPRGESVKIQNIEGLHKAIGSILAEEKRDISGKEFRFLRHEMNLTQRSLADILKVDTQTVARWEKGHSRIDGPAQLLLRLLYREFIGNNVSIVGPLKQLADLDEALQIDDLSFEDTAEGWQQAA
jgi:putative transcriptional regulator